MINNNAGNLRWKIILLIITGIVFYYVYSMRWKGDDGQTWKFTVDSDGRGYYAYLPAVFIYQDLHFDFVRRAEGSINGGMAEYPYLVNGQRGNKYFIGEAFVLTPFFLLALLVSSIANYSLNGYNQIFYGFVSIAAMFYMVLGLIFIRKTLQLYKIRDVWIDILAILVVFGTNLFHYVVIEPSMSHVYSFAFVAMFLYFMKRFISERRWNLFFFAAIAFGIVIIIRPVNAMIFFAIPFLCGSWQECKNLVYSFFKNFKIFLPGLIIMSMIIFLEPLVLYLTYGDFFHWPYKGEKFNFFKPHFFDFLFSYRKGWFIYTPLMFLATASIFLQIKKSKYQVITFLFFFLFLNYVLSSWESWSYGGCFSMRPYVEYYSLFILPLAIGLNEMKRKIHLIGISLLLSFILFLSIFQLYQYEHKIISYDSMDKEKYWKVFLKSDPKYKLVAYPIFQPQLDESKIVFVKDIFNDFEGSLDWGAKNTITTDEYYSKTHGVKVDKNSAFGPAYMLYSEEMIRDKISHVKIKLMTKSTGKHCDAALIVSMEGPGGRIYKYESYPISLVAGEINVWKEINFLASFSHVDEKSTMKIYVWNFTDCAAYIDDMDIKLISAP